MAAAVLKALKVAAAILQDMITNDGQTLAKIAVGIITLFFTLLLLILMPVIIHERVPVTTTKAQALWYYNAAMAVTNMTQSPCDPGVYVDWQEVIAIDAVRYKQNFKKSSLDKAMYLAGKFVEQIGECTYCTGEGEDEVCTTYTTYRLKSIDEVMDELEMSEKEKQTVKSKYRVIDFNFLIGFRPESAAGDYDELYSGDLSWPLSGHHSISSPYGMRIHPVTGNPAMHYGIDIPAAEGTPITAPANGQIRSFKWSDAVGWTMEVDHGKNELGKRIITRYCHLSEDIAQPGQKVKAGDVIAKVGNTGYLTTGAHLHLEVYVDGVTHDPAEFFQTR